MTKSSRSDRQKASNHDRPACGVCGRKIDTSDFYAELVRMLGRSQLSLARYVLPESQMLAEEIDPDEQIEAMMVNDTETVHRFCSPECWAEARFHIDAVLSCVASRRSAFPNSQPRRSAGTFASTCSRNATPGTHEGDSDEG